MNARSTLGFHAGRCAMWTVASRDCYAAVARMSKIEGPVDGLSFAGRALLGFLAFELALDAARWVLANDTTAGTGLPVTEQQVTAEWARVRALRSDVIAHMDTWIQQDIDSQLMVSSAGLSVRGELKFAFSDWQGWLEVLEPWALTQGLSDRRPVDEMLIPPPKVPLKRLRHSRS